MIDAPQSEEDAVDIIPDYRSGQVSAKYSSFKTALSYARTLLCWPRSCGRRGGQAGARGLRHIG